MTPNKSKRPYTQQADASPLVSLSRDELKGKSVYAIGDIHGCYEELIELEDRIQNHAGKLKKTPLIICVGDYCDRGPASAQVIEHLAHGISAGTHLGVLGNHEWYFLAANASPRIEELAKQRISWPSYLNSCADIYKNVNGKYPSAKELRETIRQIQDRWTTNGGELTMNSYATSLKDTQYYLHVPSHHLTMLLLCPIVIETPFGIISHAQIHRSHLDTLKTNLGGSEEERTALRWAVEQCLWNRELPKEPVTEKLWHFSGHTPAPGIRRSAKNHWIRFDTGCVYGNKLTAIHMQTKQSFSVRAKSTYKEKKIFSQKSAN